MRSLFSPLSLAVVALSAVGCTRPAAPLPSPDAGSPLVQAHAESALCSGEQRDDVLPPCDVAPDEAHQRSLEHSDLKRHREALACASLAATYRPEDPEVHAQHADALMALDRHADARLAIARALVANPDHLGALDRAADLYLNHFSYSREAGELALAYARRGEAAASRAGNKQQQSLFLLRQAEALNDLGRAEEALQTAARAHVGGAPPARVRYEIGLAFWQSCRFQEARREFEALLTDPEREPYVRHHLGLIAERGGDDAAAQREFETARRLAPELFPAPVEITPGEFARLVASLVEKLSPELRADLASIPVTTQDLPDLEDLTAGEPPLSPEIIGLYRGPPLNEPCCEEDLVDGPCRSIVLYRKNLMRSVRDRAELERQAETTLIHEIGHLHGESEDQLSARGLE